MTTAEYHPELMAAKAEVWRLLRRLPGPDLALALREHLSPDATWHVSHPLNLLVGPQRAVLRPAAGVIA